MAATIYSAHSTPTKRQTVGECACAVYMSPETNVFRFVKLTKFTVKLVMDFSCIRYSTFKSHLLLPSSNLLELSEEYYLMSDLNILDVWLCLFKPGSFAHNSIGIREF